MSTQFLTEIEVAQRTHISLATLPPLAAGEPWAEFPQIRPLFVMPRGTDPMGAGPAKRRGENIAEPIYAPARQKH